MVSLQDLIDFVNNNPRKEKIVKVYDELHLQFSLTKSLEDGALAVIVDTKGKIEGICAAEPEHNYKRLHVKILLTDPNTKNTLARLLDLYRQNFPDYDIQAYRGEDLILYKNTNRLVKLLTLISK